MMLKIFEQYCKKNNILYSKVTHPLFIQYRLYRDREKSIVNIYHTGTILVQGKDNTLRTQLKEFKDNVCIHIDNFCENI